MVHDRWTDRQKKWYIEVGAPSKNKKAADRLGWKDEWDKKGDKKLKGRKYRKEEYDDNNNNNNNNNKTHMCKKIQRKVRGK